LWRMDELVHGGLHPGYAFPLWHAFLAAVAKLAGVDPALVVRYESALLLPLAVVIAYEAGYALFDSAALAGAAAAAQVALAGVAIPTAAVSLALLPIARDTVSHEPSSLELRRALAHYRDQLVVKGSSYHLAPGVFARSGAVAVAGLVLLPLAVLAWRRRW